MPRYLLITLACGTLCLGACSSPPKQTESPAPATAQMPSASQPARYDLKGKVVSVDKDGKRLTVSHDAIPGFMGAMTMPYAVKDEKLLDNLTPGETVSAKVVSTGSEFWLEDIVPAQP